METIDSTTYTGPVVIEKSENLEDWYLLRKHPDHHEHSRGFERFEWGSALVLSERLSNACIEGTEDQMVELCRAILNGSNYHAKRCACRVDGDFVEVWSPRNSTRHGRIRREEAEKTAREFLASRDTEQP